MLIYEQFDFTTGLTQIYSYSFIKWTSIMNDGSHGAGAQGCNYL